MDKPDCENCPFAVNAAPRNPPLLAQRPRNGQPIGVIVGETPSKEDVEGGRPLSGSTGRQLDLELLDARIDRSKLLVITATACYPPIQVTEGQILKAVKCCQPLFWSQLKDIDPATPCLAMGKFAHLALVGKNRGAMEARGFIKPWNLIQPTEPKSKRNSTPPADK